jgi:uncharacterized protein YdaU (DUF1376 family)
MAKDPAYLFYSKDWLEGTAEMMPAEKGVYIDLLCHHHQKGSLPSDPKRLARLVGLSNDEFVSIWQSIKDKFFIDGERAYNRKLLNVMSERATTAQKNRVSGTFANIMKKLKLSADKKEFLKQSFKIELFAQIDSERVNERVTTWVTERLAEWDNERAPLLEDVNAIVNGNENEDLNQDADEGLYGKFENFFHGNVPDDLIELAGRLKPMPDAGEWQDYVQREIEKLGYTVKREQPCPYISKEGKRIAGRIDLVAGDGENVIGIELDDRQPRLKSIRKVESYEVGMVLLRDPKPVHIIKANVPVKHLVSSSTNEITKEEIEEDIFNDFNLMDSFRKENPKIDVRALWVKCWKWHSVKPSPPVHAWQWKQKLQTFFHNENEKTTLVTSNSKSTNDKIDGIKI